MADKTILAPDMAALFSELSADETAPVWVFFTDRAMNLVETESALQAARDLLPDRTLRRRAKGGTPELDEKDLPVHRGYIDAVAASGAKIRTITRYFNGVSADMTLTQVEEIASLPFVKAIQPVARGKRHEPQVKKNYSGRRVMDYNYGESYTQLQQINVPVVHDMGLTGEGVLVCMLDTGYNLEHITFWEMDILATWDFINGDSIVVNQPYDPDGQHDHGTFTLSTCGGMLDCMLYGPAFESTFMLGKTEMVDQEIPIEEDYYVAGLEWADSTGADVVSTSLGYLDWYTFEDMDGNTAVTTIGVDIAVANGIVCCTAAGNERNSSWGHIIAPADADSVIAVGAVDDDGDIAWFSSPGPTFDGRIKPEVCAMGVAVYCADPDDVYGFVNVNGTSLSTPLLGGVSALVVQAHPNWPPMSVREALMMTASQSATPDNDYGWGIVDVFAAIMASSPPQIESRIPEEDTLVVEPGETVNFSIVATDPDGDPLTYIFMVDDTVRAEGEFSVFDWTFNEIGSYGVTAIAQDLVGYDDETSWEVIVEEAAELTVSLTPANPPIIIPASGGSFDFDLLIENGTDSLIVFDGWTEAILPNGVIYGPIILRTDLSIAPGGILSREDLNQFAPAGAPSGEYSYFAKLGQYPDDVWAADSFTFEKEVGLDVAAHDYGWALFGWGEEVGSISIHPNESALFTAYPNPFNPLVNLDFTIQREGNVALRIFDIQGREVAGIVDGWLAAGDYQRVFDGSHLSSGVYFVKLTAPGVDLSQKILLIK